MFFLGSMGLSPSIRSSENKVAPRFQGIRDAVDKCWLVFNMLNDLLAYNDIKRVFLSEHLEQIATTKIDTAIKFPGNRCGLA